VAEDLSQEQIDEWKNKVSEFTSVDEFANALKAFAYENAKNKNKGNNGTLRMSLPNDPIDDDSKKSLWDRLKPLIINIRKSRGNPNYCHHFEKLANKLEFYIKR
jgi:hypothetical protein